ncbi:MAG: efflux RND transporter periplasmic adaptor subunit [Chitinophagia bacterium]|nr:efflux RND transporter periplasmic adaptor subunit [Chitinophagia bacterium]
MTILQRCILIGVFTGMIACKSKKENHVEVGKFQITSALQADTSVNKEYVAEIQSVQNVEIRAKVKGYIESIHADEGQRVSSGQLLFTIRPIEYEAALLKAKAEVKKCELEVQNVKILAEKNIVSKTELSLALAKLDQAKSEETLAELYVTYTKIRAPFEGIIDRLKFKQGSLIDEGTLLTSISNNRDVYAYFNVSEVEYLDFKSRNTNNNKMTAGLILANNQPHQYKGQVETIESEFDKNTGSIAFRAKFPNPGYLLKHGETGKVQLKVQLKDALLIPQKATFELQDKIYVYVVDEKNIVHTRQISIKQKLNNIYVVEDGLTVNDKFILEGIQSAKDDAAIETTWVEPRKALSLK